MTWVLGVGRGRFTWAEIGFWPARWQPWYLAAALGLMVAFTPLRALLALAVQWLLEGSLDSLQSRSDLLGTGLDSPVAFGLTLLFAGLLVPISEELYFRGLLLRWFQPRLGRWPRIVLTAVLFGLAHFDSVGVMVSTFLLGLFCADAYERTRSIWFAIAIHAVNNSVAVFLLYFTVWVTNHFAR
jgi:membrane protease YdiL (CAAX protease family)